MVLHVFFSIKKVYIILDERKRKVLKKIEKNKASPAKLKHGNKAFRGIFLDSYHRRKGIGFIIIMPVSLTPNAIAAINAGDVNLKPLLQVLDIKSIGKGQERYRLLISDGVSAQHAMLAVQLNDRVKSRQVEKGSIVQLVDYICSNVKDRKVIVVLNMETIVPHCETIGNPTMSSESDTEAQKQLSAPGNILLSTNRGPVVQHSVNKAPPRGVNIQNPVSGSTPSFRPSVQPSYQPPPSYRNHGSIMKNEAPARIIPIAALNPYQGRWAIKARVTAKGDIRQYNNAKGDGKVFSFDLLDSDGGEIRVTCFNAFVDQFHDVIEIGKVYLISKGSLKPAQKNFNHLKNEWEFFLESASTVELCPDEDGFIPRQQFSFRPISDIECAENNTILDIIGVVTSVNPSMTILRKNGMETHRRILNLKDESGKAVEVTLWGEFCNRDGRKLEEMVDSASYPVLAIKAGKVSDFSGKSVGTISSTQLFINPDFPEAHRVRNWFDRGGKDAASSSISRDAMPGGGSRNEIRKTVSQIKEEGLGRSDKPDWVTVKATISFIKIDSFCYTACPLMIGDKQCNKKVTRSATNKWLCDRCNQESEECDYRYLLQVQIQDHTGVTWVTAFQESGEEIMGCPAKQLYTLKYELQSDEEFAEVIRNRLFHQYMLKLKIKEEVYGDEQRVKMTMVRIDKVNYTSESKYLLDLLAR